MNPVNSDMEMILRLGGATLAGAIVGLNRELTHKPAGLRTHALVSLGSAVMTLISVRLMFQSSVADDGAVLRTIQGIITGIGFIGGGVILRLPREQTVHGLTTAASIWIVAALGIACGLADWKIAGVATLLGVIILAAGRPLERKLLGKKDSGTASDSEDDEEEGEEP